MEHDESVAKLLEAARLRATPIDFVSLIREGVLKPVGKNYLILTFGRLPEHATARMRVVRQRQDGSMVVRFLKPNKKLAREYERITGERLPKVVG